MRHDLIKSTARTLQILELFNEQRRPLGLTYIYTQLGYPQSSTTALLKSMVLAGYLNYDRRGRTYFPTGRVAALGDWIEAKLYRPETLDLLQTVYDRTGEIVALSAQNDIFVQHVRVLKPDGFDTAAVESTLRVLPKSAAGLVIMSETAPAALQKLVRHIGAYERQPVKVADLQAHLQWIRREGYCLLTAFPYAFASAIAMPLPQEPDRVPLALGVGGVNNRIVARKSEIIRIMRDAIADYAARLDAVAVPAAGAGEREVSPT